MLSRSSDRFEAASSNTSTTPGPRAFATYIAASASRSIVPAVVSPRAPSTPPMLAETLTRSPCSSNGSLQRLDQPPADLGDVVQALDLAEHRDELVAAEAGQQVP